MKKLFLLILFLLIAGCVQDNTQNIIINDTIQDINLTNDSIKFIFNQSKIQQFILHNNIYDVKFMGGSAIIDYYGTRKSVVDEAHKNNIAYAPFISIVAIENDNDIFPESRALSIDGTPLLEHNIDGWYLHSLSYNNWINYIKSNIKDSIDKGADFIVLDDDFVMAQFPKSSQDNIVGDFSNKTMEGFTNYLLDKKVINDSDFNYRIFLYNKGFNEDLISGKLINNFYISSNNLDIPYWSYYQDYMIKLNINFLKNITNYVHNYSKSINKTIYVVPYPDLFWYNFFDSDVGFDFLTGEIIYGSETGYPSKGRFAQYVKLGYSQLNKPKCFKYPDSDEEVNAMKNSDRLLALRYAETYANKGCVLINPLPMTTEEMGNPLSVLFTKPLNMTLINNIMNFVYNNEDLFKCNKNNNILVLFSPSSQEKDSYNYRASFNGITNLLINLNIQFDVSTINKTELNDYDLIIAPHLLDNNEAKELINYINQGGRLFFFLGDDIFQKPNNFNNINSDNFIEFEQGNEIINYYHWIMNDIDEFNKTSLFNSIKNIINIDSIITPNNINIYSCNKNIIHLINYNNKELKNFNITLPYKVNNSLMILQDNKTISLNIINNTIKIPYLDYWGIIKLS